VIASTLGITKTGILLLSMIVLMTSVFLTDQAFAVDHFSELTCADCDLQFEICEGGMTGYDECAAIRDSCKRALMCNAVGGEFIGIETTSVLAAGAQYTAAWMIPVIVSGIGFAIVIARKF